MDEEWPGEAWPGEEAPVAEPTPAPTQAQAAPANEEQWPGEQWPGKEQPKAESLPGTFTREALHSAVPAAGGMLTAGAAGALAGTLGAGPVGTFLGGLAGMIVGSMATDKVQEYALDQIGFDDAEQRAANMAENPKTSFAGGLAPALATMSPVKGVQLAQRGIGGGLMGGFEAGQELLHDDHVDPFKVGASIVAGAALPKANRVGEALLNTGAKAANRIVPGRPGQQANPAAVPAQDEAAASQQQTVTGEASLAQDPPPVSGETTGNPQSAPSRSARTYPKGDVAETPRGDILSQGDLPPDVAQALQASLDSNALKPETLPDLPPQPDPSLRQGLNPGETLPIETGITEAASQPQQAVKLPRVRRNKPPIETGLEEAAAANAGEAPAIVGEFTTSKGSTYQVHPDGTTTRTKAARPDPGHEGDEGLKPKSEKTFYLTKEQADALAPPQDSRFMVIDNGDGFLSLATPGQDGKWGIAPSQRMVGPTHPEPVEGAHPLELWGRGKSEKTGTVGYSALHFGNKIEYLGQNKPKDMRARAEPTGEWRNLSPDQPAHPVHEKINTAAADVHPDPTPGQGEAGNYKKGHPGRVFGREFSIETAKGGTRKDLKNDPPQWEVKDYPTHYGELLGTKGADGDRLDYHHVGTGDRHFIIDQRDLGTRKFDEHKIMGYAKDVHDAADHYQRGFNDGKGGDRLGSIKEVSEDDLKAWLAKPGKKKDPYDPNFKHPEGSEPVATEGVKPLPKVVTAAVNELKAKGNHEAAAKLEAMEPTERLKVASQFVNKTGTELARPDRIRTPAPTVEGILNDQGQPVTANSKASAAAKSADVKVMNDAFAKHLPEDIKVPTTPEEKAALRQQAQDFLDATKDVTYRPALKHAPYLYARAAKKLLTAKNPADKSWQEFVEIAHQLKNGGETDVRQGQRINADIERSRRSGEDALADAEKRSASTNTVEDEMIANLDAKRAGKDQGYLDVPHEEAEGMVKPQAVTAENVEKFETKTGKLDLAKPADRMKLQSDSAQLAANLVKEAKRAPPVKESEGGASPVRKISVAGVDVDAILARAKKAETKNKTSEHAVREDELGGIHSDKTAPRDKLAEFWNNESGSLDYKKLTQSFRSWAKPINEFYTKTFGGLTNDRQLRLDPILARALSHESSQMAEKARALYDTRYYQWLDNTSGKGERLAYIKTIEKPEHDTPAKLKQAFTDAGIPAKNIDWMVDEAMFHRKLMDEVWRQDAAHGSDAGYIKNYVAHIFDNAKVGGQTADQFIHNRVQSLGPTWYQKERVFDLMEAAIKAGFKPKFDNPVDILNARWTASIRANTIVAAARNLHEAGLAFPIKDLPETHKGLLNAWTYKRQLPDRQQWVFSPDAALLWENSIEPHGLSENKYKPGSVYRAWMQVKNFMVPVQLMLSQFHAFHVVANIMPAQALYNAMERSRGDGKWFKNFGQAAKEIASDGAFAVPMSVPVLGNFLHAKGYGDKHIGRGIQEIWRIPDAELSGNEVMVKNMFKEAGASPYQSHEDVIGAKRKFAEAVNKMSEDPGLLAAGKVAIKGLQRGMELLQEPLFKHTIPALKNAALLRSFQTALTKDPTLASNPTMRQTVFRELAKDIDDRFGEMFYKGLFWDKTLKDVGIGSMLSLSWNLGQVRQVAGAAAQGTRMVRNALGINDGSNLRKAREEASNKIGFVSLYAGLSMVTAGAITWALTGERPKELTDYVFPRSGHIDPETGHPHRLTSPFNTREVIMLKAHADEHNSWVGGAMQLLWNKMILQPVTELWTNRDFFGRALYDTNAPAWKATLQGIDSVLGRSLSPISISGADRAKQQGLGVKGQALSYLGFGPGPKYVNETPLERRINHLSHTYAPQHRPYEYGEKTGAGRGLVQGAVRYFAEDETKSEARTSARNALNQARTAGDSEAELEARRKMVTKGELSSRIVSKMVPGRQFEGEFGRLPKEEQLAVAKTMSNEEFQRFVMTNKDVPRANRLALMQQWAAQRNVKP
jgi:hypothetical protein